MSNLQQSSENAQATLTHSGCGLCGRDSGDDKGADSAAGGYLGTVAGECCTSKRIGTSSVIEESQLYREPGSLSGCQVFLTTVFRKKQGGRHDRFHI